MATHSMHRFPVLLGLIAILTLALTAGKAPIAAQQASISVQPSSAAPNATFRSSPVMFIENAGQWPEAAHYQVWSGLAGTMWLAEDAIWLTVAERSTEDATRSRVDTLGRFDPERADLQRGDAPRKAANIKLSFVDANPHPRIEPFDRLDTVVSYFIGNEPDQWRPDVPVWGGVRYVELYPGVNVEITSRGGQMVQRLDAQPGADLSAVRLRVEGADNVTADGEVLRLGTAAGGATWPLLQVDELQVAGTKVQMRDSLTSDVAAPFAPTHVSPQAKNENPQSPADNPTDLLYGTFLGGSNGDYGSDVTVDEAGCAYVTGYTSSTDFPTIPGAFDRTFDSSEDAFVVKLCGTNSTLAYATFLGGGYYDQAQSIAVNRDGQAFITGWTNSWNFPTTSGAFDTTTDGHWHDVFVTRLNATGSALVYSTFLGGSNHDRGQSITFDGSNQAYISGWTLSSDFPTTVGAFDRTHNGGYGDGFVAKLSSAGNRLVYATFLGGSGSDSCSSIAVDEAGNTYVAGSTSSADFPTTSGASDRSLSGNGDGFVVKLNGSGSGLLYSTFLGGSVSDACYGIAVDRAGSAYVTGSTSSPDFPTTSGAYDRSYNGNSDAFMAKLNGTGSGLVYASFLGGSARDEGAGIVVDGVGSAHVTGITVSADFPTTPSAFSRSSNVGDCYGNPCSDTFVVKLSHAGSELLYSTFLGGSGSEDDGDIAVDEAGRAYATGSTGSSDFPTTSNASDWSYNGGGDAFVVKLAMGVVPTYTISGRVTEAGGFTGIGGVTVWAGSTRSTTTNANGDYTFTGLPAGTYSVRPSLTPYAFSPASSLVSVPANQTGVNFRKVAITKVQVNQALGNTTNYVAGKDTVIQVIMSDRVPYDPVNQQVVVKRGGVYVTTLKPIKPAFPSQTLNFWGKMADCGNWQQGNYTFEVTVNGVMSVITNQIFRNRIGFTIRVVPVLTRAGMPNFGWGQMQRFIESVYPLSEDGITWRLWGPLDARDLDLTYDYEGGKKTLEDRLKALQPPGCDVAEGNECPRILGIIHYDPAVGKGWTRTARVAVVADVPEMQTVIAHEIGHDIGFTDRPFSGLGDVYNGGMFQCLINPAPRSYVGRDGRDGPTGKSCIDSTAVAWIPSPLAPNASGATILGTGDNQDWPYEIGGRGILGNKLSFMGHGESRDNFWVTPDVYGYLFDQFAEPMAQVAAFINAEVRVTIVSGWIDRDGSATLQPAYQVAASDPVSSTGAYSIEVLDPQGQLMASQGFDVSFVSLSDPPQDSDNAPFRVAVRLHDGAQKLRIKHDTTVLTEMTISAHAPALSLTSPIAGQTWAATGNYTIRWQGNDLDGDSLYYTVLYRQGAGDWMVLGADLTTNELNVDAAYLPGGTAAQMQVLATDGINTTAVESGLFTVGRKPPEAFIIYPAEGASFMPGASFFLQGAAYDLEDGTLPDPAYHWTSNKDGDLGTGASNLVILSPGPHVITLTVTDSDGNTAVKTIRLSAGDQVFLPLISRSQ